MVLKNIIFGISVLASALGLGACSQKPSANGVCGSAGLYASQDNCLTSNASATCTMTNIQVEGQNLICWQKSTSNNNTGTGNGGSNTGSGNENYNPCAPGNPKPQWATSAWNPSACAPGVTSLSRQVYCPYECECEGERPADAQSCIGDLYNSNHYSKECLDQGGVVVTKENKNSCLFSKSSCPSGWEPFLNASEVPYTKTFPKEYVDVLGCFGSKITKLTDSHDLAAIWPESATYCTEMNFWCTSCKTTAVATATVTAVLCY
jgi:hypothetical protein